LPISRRRQDAAGDEEGADEVPGVEETSGHDAQARAGGGDREAEDRARLTTMRSQPKASLWCSGRSRHEQEALDDVHERLGELRQHAADENQKSEVWKAEAPGPPRT